MDRLLPDIKKSIDDTYANQSIHKSIIVCHDDIMRIRLYETLKADHYPVCNITNLIKFVRDQSRMLPIDFSDLNNLETFLPRKTMKEINFVFIIERAHLRNKREGFKWRHYNFADGYKVIKV